jgi:fructosamine-3-kinase
MDGPLRDALGHALGSAVVETRAVGGGDVAVAYRLGLADGRSVFAKTHPDAPPGCFGTESRSLAWLRAAGAVAVPHVLAVSDAVPSFLALEWVDRGSPRPDTDATFGRDLAALHRAGAPCFGREDRRTTGSRGLPNEPAATWAEFFRDSRLLPLAALARRAAALPDAVVDTLVRVAERLEDIGGPPEPPARLHGDLWAGNRMVGVGGRSWLVDPAAHGGHREFDLAMMRLFGGFGPECFAAYAEVAPLAAGWEARVALHQIAPLVVHAIKFGGGYVRAAGDAIATYA